jgi:acetylglutamate kinase
MNPADRFAPQIAKADVLVEALPYMQRFRDETFLIKFGGSAMDDPVLVDQLLRDIVFLEAAGINPVIVHGGGKAISRAMEAAGLEARFIGGFRITDRETISIVEQTLTRVINPGLVDAINAHGGRAMGIPGNEVFRAERILGKNPETGSPVDIGFVGKVSYSETAAIKEAIAQHIVPVISPVAREVTTGDCLNVNADLAASALARHLGAAKLIYLSDVAGVLGNKSDVGSLISSLAAGSVDQLITEGVIAEGMIPKVLSAVEAIGAGVGKVHMIDGRLPHSLILEVFTDLGIGTEIVP